MSRRDAMAQIDTILLNPGQDDLNNIPIPPPPPPLSKAEKKAQSEQQKAEKEQEEGRLKAEKEQGEQRDLAKSGLMDQAGNAWTMAVDLWKNIQSGVSNLPQPGSIMLPFGVLLVFFFLLLPVNGHTRAAWIWLTLTGQASIAPVGGISSGDFGTPSPAATGTPTGVGNFVAPLPLNQRPTGGTYAEDSGGFFYS